MSDEAWVFLFEKIKYRLTILDLSSTNVIEMQTKEIKI